MENIDIYNAWTEFIQSEQYSGYFLSNEEKWYNILEDVKEYIDNNDKRPSAHDDDIDINTLGTWISCQQRNYNKKQQCMKNIDIYDTWSEFIQSEQYSKHFMGNDDKWYEKLSDVKKYINDNQKRPSPRVRHRDKDRRYVRETIDAGDRKGNPSCNEY